MFSLLPSYLSSVCPTVLSREHSNDLGKETVVCVQMQMYRDVGMTVCVHSG